ncbi:MAG: YjbQ family protein [Rhodospirillales bacterium]|nr:MAG: YjbQ family protein [Rhodospirillales bacterium]
MRQAQGTLSIRTQGPGLYEVTEAVAEWLGRQSVTTGLLTVFCRHTSASLTIQENADADVRRDLEDFFAGLAPADQRRYRHTAEGPDDMPAHIRSALTDVQIAIPIADGRLALGTWQGLFLFEHRSRAHQRSLILHVIGE